MVPQPETEPEPLHANAAVRRKMKRYGLTQSGLEGYGHSPLVESVHPLRVTGTGLEHAEGAAQVGATVTPWHGSMRQ